LRQDVESEDVLILVFAGGWGWGTETVELLVQRNWRLRKHLRVLGQVSDAELIWLYRNALFSVFPSYAEGFGLGAAESLSFGTPVVISDCPSAPIGVMQERIGAPSTSTTQAPHWPSPQPNLAALRPRSLRST